MPLITIQICPPGESAEKKSKVIEQVTKVVAETLEKPMENVWVIIDEVDPDNWGAGGNTVSKLTHQSEMEQKVR